MKKYLSFFLTFFVFSALATIGFAHNITFNDLYSSTPYQVPSEGYLADGTRVTGLTGYLYEASPSGLQLGRFIGTGTQSLLGNMGDDNVLQLFQNSLEGYSFQIGSLNVNSYLFKESGGKDPLSGTWSIGSGQGDLSYLVVKGATSFSVLRYYPAVSAGLWDVGYLGLNNGGQIPAMSFVRGYSSGTPISEPGTVMLLGAGLILLAGVSRKKIKK